MKIKIYQIDRDKDNGSLSFLNYENTVKRTGGRIRSEIYHKVFDGDVECSGLEDVYFMFNENRPESFTGHSLSVSDIVEIENSDIVEKGYYFCDSFGFKMIDFEPSLAVESKKEQITVVICEPGKLARVANIGTELKDLQAVVGGNTKHSTPMKNRYVLSAMMRAKFAENLLTAPYTTRMGRLWTLWQEPSLSVIAGIRASAVLARNSNRGLSISLSIPNHFSVLTRKSRQLSTSRKETR